MSWLVEDPTYVLVTLSVAEAALLIALLKTGSGRYLASLAGVALLALAVVLLDRFVVTDREKIEQTLYGAAQALEQNNVEDVVAFLSADAEALEREVRARMRSADVQESQILDARIEIDDSAGKGTARILARLELKVSGTGMSQALVRAQIRFVRQGSRWLIQSYQLQRR